MPRAQEYLNILRKSFLWLRGIEQKPGSQEHSIKTLSRACGIDVMTDRKADPIQKISCHMIFTGRVQGVGFRFTAQRFAHELGVNGWVKNLPDGSSVELFVQGEALLIERLTERLKEQFLIHDVRMGTVPPGSTLTSFEIRY